MRRNSEKETVVVLRRVAYSDRHSILTGWSKNHGRVSLLSADGSNTRSSARLRALTTVPSIVECIVHRSAGREIAPISEVSTVDPLMSLRMSPIKTMVGTFLSEVMALMLVENHPDEALWEYIVGSLQALDREENARAIANFHICFLYRFGSLMGVEPDISTWRPGRFFNLEEGVFVDGGDGKSLVPGESVVMLSRMNFGNLSCFRLTREERQQVLDVELEYLRRHLSRGGVGLKSLDVLRSLLS